MDSASSLLCFCREEGRMNFVSDSALALRRRGGWEAADAGILLWRKNFFHFILIFALPVWVTAFALRLVPENFHWVSWLGLWWLKPLFDRLVLHVISVRFFTDKEESPRLMQGLGGDVIRGLLGDLTWRRFSPARAAGMPLRILERLKAKQYRRRKGTLAAGGINFCVLVTALCLVLEWFLLGSEIVFFRMAVEMFIPNLFETLTENYIDTEIFIFAAYCFNYILIESIYVCMGFCIYINSRVEVEGWDIQLLFRRFSGVKVVLLLCCFFLFFSPPAVSAETPDSEAGMEVLEDVQDEPQKNYFPESFIPAESIPMETLKEILDSDDFGGTKESWGIRLKNQDEKDIDTPDIDLAPWAKRIKEIFAFILRLLVILIIAAGAVFVIIRLLKLRKFSVPYLRKKGRFRENPMVSPEDPARLFEKAEELYSSGEVREAWAFCLRGAITALARRRKISFPPDATEYGCLALVGSAAPDLAGAFGELVGTWVNLAYGAKAPLQGSFEQSLKFARNIKEAESAGEARIA
jgi:hypothetical protein